ncbi:hypothetical protein GW17_00001621 [Ensete ventricosum]|nr:hypothetical protein GW17_00001621 [Ensete ventricosum]
MSVHGCINQVIDDNGEDDEGPIIFKRPNSSSRQSRLSCSSKKTAPHKHDGFNITSNQNAGNGENSHVQNAKVLSTVKPSSEKLNVAISSSRSCASLQDISYHKSTTNDVGPKHQDESSSEVQESDDSNDDKPLSHGLNSFSVAVQKKKSTDLEKIHMHSLDHKFVKKRTDQMDLDKPVIKNEDSDYSDDDKPLSYKFSSSAAVNKGGFSHVMKAPQSSKPTSPPYMKMSSNIKEYSDDSEDEKPLLSRFQSKATGGSSMKDSNSDEKPFSSKLKVNGSSKKEKNSENTFPKGGQKRPLGDTNPTESSNIKKVKVSETPASVKVKYEVAVKKEIKADDSDHVPIAQRMKKTVSSNSTSVSKSVLHKTHSSFKKDGKKMKTNVKDFKYSKSLKVPPGSGGGQKWTTLEHNGVIFPPPYKPHGVKMLYNGQPVDLTPEQEEVREKKAIKEEKLKQEEKYMWAIVDGVKEKVGNFRVEPPGLFRGRGEHPKVLLLLSLYWHLTVSLLHGIVALFISEKVLKPGFVMPYTRYLNVPYVGMLSTARYGDDLFDLLDTSKLNAHLKELMPGLTAKGQRDELKMDLSRARKGKPPLKDKEGKTKKNLSPEV